MQTLILGGPGCGKTTALIAVLDKALKDGIAPDRIAFLAFTRKAANEAKERACAKFGFDDADEDLPFFRTIHSFAFKMLGLRREEVMSQSAYREIGHELRLSFGEIDEATGLPLGLGRGDRFCYLEQLARVTRQSLEDICLKAGERYYDVKLYKDTLDAFKHLNSVLDFTDMLEKYLAIGDVPDFDLAIIDEAQDLSQLQWEVIDKVVGGVANVFFAGDDDQAIYKWAGADIDRFLSLPGAKIVLPKSFRLPVEVFNKSQDIITGVKNRYAKAWVSKGHHGAISRYSKVDFLNCDEGTWMLLARNKYMLVEYREFLHRKGYPYILGGKSSTDNKNVRALLAWERLRAGHEVSYKQVCLVYRALNAHALDDNHRVFTGPKTATFTIDMLVKDYGLKTRDDWMVAIQMPPTQREYYRSIKQRGESLVGLPRITLATIHTVKGGEADHVAILPDMAASTYKEWLRDPDSESRVFFVAVSRAKYSLHLIHPQTSSFFPL